MQSKEDIHKSNNRTPCELCEKHPEMALEIWYEWHGVRKRNLISLCHDCHEAVHGYRKPEEKKPLTEERWD